MGISDFYIRVVKALDEIGAPYMIVGAFGGSVFGIIRSTNDIDMLVDLQEKDCYAISEKFPLPRYYADPEMMKNSIEMGIMFNLIDTEEGARADLVPLKREPGYQLAFNRRVKETFQTPSGEVFEAWVAQPTDIIIGKLHAWKEGRSDKHPKDIHAILFFCLRGYSDYDVNLDEVAQEASRLGQDVLEMWNKTLARAKEEIEKGDTPRKW
ncbi:MAG: hypothetical protein QY328_06765 [Anaerolineales bacterium]|jgi:hypothetical protein|nr:MAG: hypothetical protein QY328_06765 [Anaerolineales bacterium]